MLSFPDSPEILFELSDSLEGCFRAFKINDGAEAVSNVRHLGGVVAQVGRNLLAWPEESDEADVSVLAEHGGDLVHAVELWGHSDRNNRSEQSWLSEGFRKDVSSFDTVPLKRRDKVTFMSIYNY